MLTDVEHAIGESDVIAPLIDYSCFRAIKKTHLGPALRNLAVGIMKMAGHRNIAAASPHYARDATRTLATIGISPA